MSQSPARNGKGSNSSGTSDAMNDEGFTSVTDTTYDTKDGEGVKFRPYDEAQEIRETYHLRWYRDLKRFYTFSHGVWIDAEETLHTILVHKLGNGYTNGREDTILSILRALVPFISYDMAGSDYINFTNGMLNWRTLELKPHDHSYLSMVQIPHPWDSDATAPKWTAFLGSVVPQNPDGTPCADDMQRFMEHIGYTLYNGNPLQRMFLYDGSGNNGKGVTMRVLEHVLGATNCTHFTPHALAASRFTATGLRGTIANMAGDIDATYLKTTGMLKSLSGEDTIPCEFKYGASFDLRYMGKMIFSANRPPTCSDTSNGWARRWEILPFPQSFEGVADTGLTDKLTTPSETAGILRWAVTALQALMTRGTFVKSDASTKAKEDFLKSSNPMLQWLEERTEITDGKNWNRQQAYNDYDVWTQINKYKAISSRNFYAQLRALGYDPDMKSSSIDYIRNLYPKTP